MSVQPLQPFEIAYPYDQTVSYASLTQCYQPIVGGFAISLYLTLLHLPAQRRRYQHTDLMQQMDSNLQVIEASRQALEAVGLLDSYRDEASHEKVQQQTYLYQLYAPKTIPAFLQDALLSTALYEKIGDQRFQELMEANFPQEDPANLAKVSRSFQQQFKAASPRGRQEVQAMQKALHQAEAQQTLSFDYSKYLRLLIADGIDHAQLTQHLKEEVLALTQVYGLDEVQMAQLTKLAYNHITKRLEIEQLKAIVQQRQSSVAYVNASGEAQQEESTDFKETQVKRLKELKESYPNFKEETYQLILLAEHLPKDAFLKQTKKALDGFATDNELYYIKELSERTNLNEAVINILVYYLLVIQKNPNVYKNSLQRFANEWQQQNIQSAPQALIYIQDKEIKRQKQQERRQQSYANRRQPYQEVVPEWMKEAQKAQSDKGASHSANVYEQIDEEELLKELNELMGEGDRDAKDW